MKSQKRHNPLPPSTFLRPDSAQAAQGRHSKFKIQNPKPTLGNKGFTLIEIAVVLVILGVVFTSVLKIESVVRNAKIRQVISQYRELRTAILIYKDKYGYLPGDDPYAVAHVGARYNGNVTYAGNQKIDLLVNNPEYAWVYEHLNRAGLIKGNFSNIYVTNTSTGTISPELHHDFNGQIIVGYHDGTGAVTKQGNNFRFDNLPADAAQAIDTILDDGKPATGLIRGYIPSKPMPQNYTDISGSTLYSIMIFFE